MITRKELQMMREAHEAGYACGPTVDADIAKLCDEIERMLPVVDAAVDWSNARAVLGHGGEVGLSVAVKLHEVK